MVVNLHAASNQWSYRPDDERFLSLEDLFAAVHARRQASHEVPQLPIRSLRLQYSQDNDVFLGGFGGQSVSFSHYAFGQLATLAKAPAGYLRSLPAPLAVPPLQYGIETANNGETLTKMLYCPPSASSVGVARAFTGPNYGRIWDEQVVEAVMKVNDDGRWQVPLKAYGGVNSKTATTLYGSDRDVFVFLVDEERPIDIDGQIYFRGFYCWNSEVGNATFGLATFLYSYVCANRIIWGARNVEELRIRHTAFAPDRFVEQARPALTAMSEASAEPILETIKRAKATRLAKDVPSVEAWLKERGFPVVETKTALHLAEMGGETGSSGDPTNLWDIVQGGTAMARGIAYTDERVAAERRWSSLLSQAGVGVENGLVTITA